MKKQIVSASLALGLVLAVTGCGHAAKMYDVPQQSIAEKKTKEQVYKAVMNGALTRGWEARKVTDGLVEATYARRNFSVTVDIKYSATSYDIEYKESQGLKYDENAQTIHKNYNSWVRNLKQSINRALLYR
jgi:hypothetical protein